MPRWIHDPSHGELQQYVTGRAENAHVAGGVLRVTAIREDYEVKVGGGIERGQQRVVEGGRGPPNHPLTVSHGGHTCCATRASATPPRGCTPRPRATGSTGASRRACRIEWNVARRNAMERDVAGATAASNVRSSAPDRRAARTVLRRLIPSLPNLTRFVQNHRGSRVASPRGRGVSDARAASPRRSAPATPPSPPRRLSLCALGAGGVAASCFVLRFVRALPRVCYRAGLRQAAAGAARAVAGALVAAVRQVRNGCVTYGSRLFTTQIEPSALWLLLPSGSVYGRWPASGERSIDRSIRFDRPTRLRFTDRFLRRLVTRRHDVRRSPSAPSHKAPLRRPRRRP